MRLIDADALLMELRKTSKYFDLKFYIEESPTIKPKKGLWNKRLNPCYSPFDDTSEFIYTCSNCGFSSGKRITKYYKFCPLCGVEIKVGEAE